MSGRQRGDAPDIEHNWLSVECKYRAKLPAWMHDAMDQAIKSAQPRQMPAVILVEKGRRTGESYICFRLSDAKDHWM